MSGEAIWRAARALVGVRFRAHGRVPATGLDCVGLVAASHAGAGYPTPELPTYRLRDTSASDAAAMLCAAGAIEVAEDAVGIILLAMLSERQPHLMIAGTTTAVHAHAGLRHVVEMPMDASLRIASRWRLASVGNLRER